MMFPIYLLFVCASALAVSNEKLQQANELINSLVYIQTFKQDKGTALSAKYLLESRILIPCSVWDIRDSPIHYVILTSVLYDVARKIGGKEVDDETYHKIFADSVKEVVPQAWVKTTDNAWKVMNTLNKIVVSIKDLLDLIDTTCKGIKIDEICNALVYINILVDSNAKILFKQAETLRRLAISGTEYLKLEPTFLRVAEEHSEVSYLLKESNMDNVKQLLDNANSIGASVSLAGIPDMPRPVDDQCY